MAASLESISRTRSPGYAKPVCICAWCGTALKDSRSPRALQLEMNYGMCPRCLAKQLERLEPHAGREADAPRCGALAS